MRGTFTNAGNTISATLAFDDHGDLANFTSNDRYQSADGKTYVKYPWSTPVRDYKDYGEIRLASHGEAVWSEPSHEFVYGRFDLVEVEYNVAKAKHPAVAGVGAQRLGHVAVADR